MARFHYKAARADGEVLQGSLEAEDTQAVVRYLHTQDCVPIRIEGGDRMPAARARRGRAIAVEALASATAELATLLRAGLPLEKALGVIADLGEHPQMGALFADLRKRIKSGESLADALSQHESEVGRFYVNLVRAGEAGGVLDTVLDQLAGHLERMRALREELTSAMVYPLILVVVALASIILLMTFVVPQFAQLFEGAGDALPMPTRITLAVAGAIQAWGWLVPAAVLLAWLGLRWAWPRPGFRRAWDRFWIGVPVIGGLWMRLEVARFARTLGVLLGNGVNLLKGLGIARDTLGNHRLRAGLEQVAQGLRGGDRLSGPLREHAGFPPLAVQLVQVGEESGQLDAMLVRLADIYDAKVQRQLKRALSLLEPMLILVLGVVIGGVVISILLAIMSVNELVG